MLGALLLSPVATLLALPALSDTVSLLRRGRASAGGERALPPSTRRRLLVLVPAHDEGLLIRGCLRSLAVMRRTRVDVTVVVIADNCGDDTAAIARAAGVEAWERQDAARRGKPAALAWAIDRVPLDHYDAVCVVDADCVVDPTFAERLVEGPDVREVLTQPFIGVSNAGDSAITTLAYLYSRANNGVAFRLKADAGLNVPVGVGLCLGSALLARRGWTAFSLSEDWELYAQLTAAGERVRFAPQACIWAQEAKGIGQGKTQRQRWQAGKFDVTHRYLRNILTNGSLSWHQRADATAELLSLGPIVNTVVAITVAGLAWNASVPMGRVVALAAALGPLRLVVLTLVAANGAHDLRRILRAFAYLPVYAVGRLATFAWTLLRPPGSRWVRADRHATAHDAPDQ